MTFTATLRHTSKSVGPAYKCNVVVPPLSTSSLIITAATVTSAPAGISPAAFFTLFGSAPGGGALVAYTGNQPLAVGDAIVISFTGRLQAGLAPGAIAVSGMIARATPSPANGAPTLQYGAAIGSATADDPTSLALVGAMPRVVVATGSSSVASTGTAQLAVGVADVVRGESIDFDVSVTWAHGTSAAVLVVSTEAGLSIASGSVTSVASVLSSSTPSLLTSGAAGTVAGDGGSITFPLAKVTADVYDADTHATSGVLATASFTITCVVSPTNVMPAGTQLHATATVYTSSDATSGGTVAPAASPHACPIADMYGDACDVNCVAASTCSGHGVCHPTSGQCYCQPTWAGNSACGALYGGAGLPVQHSQLPFVRSRDQAEVVLPVCVVTGITADRTLAAPGTIITFLVSVAVDATSTADATSAYVLDAGPMLGIGYTITAASLLRNGQPEEDITFGNNPNGAGVLFPIPDGTLALGASGAVVEVQIEVSEGADGIITPDFELHYRAGTASGDTVAAGAPEFMATAASVPTITAVSPKLELQLSATPLSTGQPQSPGDPDLDGGAAGRATVVAGQQVTIQGVMSLVLGTLKSTTLTFEIPSSKRNFIQVKHAHTHSQIQQQEMPCSHTFLRPSLLLHSL